MRAVEISGLIEEGMWNYGDIFSGKVKKVFGGPRIKEMITVEKEGCSAHRIDFSILTGTYMETGAHLLSGVRTVDEVSLKELFLEAVIIKLSKGPREHITLEDLENCRVEVKERDALIIYTGWYKMWNKKGFILNSPHFEAKAMDWIVDRKIKLLAGDTPCYDDIRDPRDSNELPQLHKLYCHGALILAPVINGDKVKAGRAKLIVFPLKIKGVCASPARAILIWEH